MRRIQQYLKDNPREKSRVELDLLEAGINFYHLVSLMWDRTTRKHTKEFVIWKIREILEIMVGNLPEDIDISELENRINEEIAAIKQDIGSNPREMFALLGMEIDNSSRTKVAFTFDFKVAILIYLAEVVEEISMSEIMAKYC